MVKCFKFLCLSIVSISFPLASYADSSVTVKSESADYNEVTLASGAKVLLNPLWLQSADWQSNPDGCTAFAVSGDYCFVLDRSNVDEPRIKRFDATTGQYIDDIEIDFNGFEPTSIGDLGCDDSGNLFISSACSVGRKEIKLEDARWIHVLPSDNTLSVIDSDGHVLRQLVAKAPGFSDEYDLTKFDSFFFDRVSVRGDLITGDDVVVVVNVGVRRNGYGTAWAPNYYMMKGEGLEWVDFLYDQSVTSSKYTAAGFASGKFSVSGDEDAYFSLYPVSWQSGVFYGYEKDPAQILTGLSGKESSRYVIKSYNGAVGLPYAIVPEGATGCAGARNFVHGDDVLMALPYVDDATGQVRVSLSQPSFKCNQDEIQLIKQKDIESTSDTLFVFPHNGSLDGRTDIGLHTASICAVNEHVSGAYPLTSLYFYAPGRGMGKYEIGAKGALTSVESIEGDGFRLYAEGRKLHVSENCKVELYNLMGMKLMERDAVSGEPLDLSVLNGGVYVASACGRSYKIVVK